MRRHTPWICAGVIISLVASPVQAVEKFWVGGTGNLTDAAEYTDNVAPTSGDILDIGAGGTATYSTPGPVSFQKLRAGHIQGAASVQGSGTVTIDSGAVVSLTVGGSGNVNGSLWVGNGADGTLNIDGAGTSVTAAQVIAVGYSETATNATLNITNGGALTATAGNVNLGDRITSGTGASGHVNISGSGSALSVNGSGADLNVGVRAGSSFMQSGGTVTVADQLVVGQNTAANSTYSISDGSLTSAGIGIGQNSAANSSMTVSGGTVSTGGITAGDNANAGGTKFNASGGTVTATAVSIGIAGSSASSAITGSAIINVTTNSFNVGTGAGTGNSLLVAGTAQINILSTASGTGNVFLGRSTSKDTSFTMTGGSISTGRNFLMGSTGASQDLANVVGTQSSGTITTTLNFVVTDTGGRSTYNLNGGSIVAHGLVHVGRQMNTGTMNQTGGSVTADNGVNVGNAESGTTSVWGTGFYNVSGGTITANSPTGNGLSIGPQGTGMFRVIGDDATINVGGNMLVNAGGGAQGTLAYQLETGDLLSQINVSGNATFNAGAILSFDTSLASPTQTTYNLLTALDIIDNGITLNGPAGWNYQIVPGGNGEILQLFQPGPAGVQGDYNNNGVVDAADYVLWREGGPIQNEVTGVTPGTVTPEDYDAWRARFGNTSGSGSAAAAVPEPTVMLLCLSGVVGLLSGRRR